MLMATSRLLGQGWFIPCDATVKRASSAVDAKLGAGMRVVDCGRGT
jgi:hypothetical protein